MCTSSLLLVCTDRKFCLKKQVHLIHQSECNTVQRSLAKSHHVATRAVSDCPKEGPKKRPCMDMPVSWPCSLVLDHALDNSCAQEWMHSPTLSCKKLSLLDSITSPLARPCWILIRPTGVLDFYLNLPFPLFIT